MNAFRYSDDQWRAIVNACGDEAQLSRTALESLASKLRFLQRQSTSEATQLRMDDLAILADACDIIDKLKHNDDPRRVMSLEFMRSILMTNAYFAGVIKKSGKSRSTMYRDLMIRLAVRAWISIGGKPGVSRTPDGGQPYGPMVRFVQACVGPVLGPVEGNAVDTVHRKLKREDAPSDLSDLERQLEQAFPIVT